MYIHTHTPIKIYIYISLSLSIYIDSYIQHTVCKHCRRAPDSYDSSTASEGKNCFSFVSVLTGFVTLQVILYTYIKRYYTFSTLYEQALVRLSNRHCRLEQRMG